jgi:hypothetical protein
MSVTILNSFFHLTCIVETKQISKPDNFFLVLEYNCITKYLAVGIRDAKGKARSAADEQPGVVCAASGH